MWAHLAPTGALVQFTVSSTAGAVSGLARVQLHVAGRRITYTGTAQLLRGTGRYAQVRADGLTVTGQSDLAGARSVFRIRGRLTA